MGLAYVDRGYASEEAPAKPSPKASGWRCHQRSPETVARLHLVAFACLFLHRVIAMPRSVHNSLQIRRTLVKREPPAINRRPFDATLIPTRAGYVA